MFEYCRESDIDVDAFAPELENPDRADADSQADEEAEVSPIPVWGY